MPFFKESNRKKLYSVLSETSHESEDDLIEKDYVKPTQSGILSSKLFFLVHGIFLLLNLWIFASYHWHLKDDKTCPAAFFDLESSPAAEAVKFETRYLDEWFDTNGPFIGEPRLEVQESWEALREYSEIHISESIIKDLGRKYQAVKLPDGSGYLGTLNVYHELHCLDQFYRSLHSDIYFPDMSRAEQDDQLIHLEHCIEALRQSIKCNADVSLVTYRWGQKQPMPMANWTIPRVCKNWDSIHDWAERHSVPHLHDPGWLMHPTLGPAYANVSRIGVVHDDT